MKIRLALSAIAASLAILGSALAAPAAQAEPTGDGAAAKAALDSIKPAATDAASIIDGIAAANEVLNGLGISPFTPTLGACTDFSFPLAAAGAIPGPTTPGLGDVTIPGGPLFPDLDLNSIKKGEILYGFVPVGVFNDTADKSGMRVAWFNVNTFNGGFGEPMAGLADTLIDVAVKRAREAALPGTADVVEEALRGLLEPVVDALPANGARAGLVETGDGTVLSAIYGTVNKGDATCFFFPSLGIATAA